MGQLDFWQFDGPLAFEAWPAHIARMFTPFEPDDYSMVVKNRAKHPKPWRWEIYCAGHRNPIVHSPVYFETMTMAHRAGKEAIKLFLAKRHA